MTLTIDSVRLSRELESLATFSDAPAPAVTRVVFSEADQRARVFMKDLFAAAGLAIREDAVGNTFARWIGTAPEIPAIGTGSHIDAIPFSGRYDGTVGVLGGLEAIRALQRSGFRPRRSIELVLFTSEEPTRFGIGCLGSRFLGGLMDAATIARLRDGDGKTLEDLRAAAGFTGELAQIPLPRGYYDAFVELHIEQGPVLERERIPLGVVTAIAAPASLRLFVEGEGGHAGAVLMPQRRDALCAAAEIILAIEETAKGSGAIDTVATVGICDVFPRAVNSIPSGVELSLDARDTDLARRHYMLAKIEQAYREVAARRGVLVRAEMVNADAPAECAPRVVATVEAACNAHGLAYKKMVSRAYHDTLFLSRIAPAAMIFIPCRGGVSHRPDEFAEPEAIARGTLVLAEALAQLSG